MNIIQNHQIDIWEHHLGNINITEINPPYEKLFDYYVNPPIFLQSIAYHTDGLMVPPYNPLGRNRDINCLSGQRCFVQIAMLLKSIMQLKLIIFSYFPNQFSK